MRETIEQYLNKKTNHAVITIPVYFNDAQHQVRGGWSKEIQSK